MEINQGLPPPAPVGESTPPIGPQGGRGIAAIAAGAYTDIVAIYGPSEAAYGDTVNIQVAIKNLATYAIYIAATGRYNGTDITLSPEYASVPAGNTYSFTASFTMPNKKITLDIWSWYWTGSEWYQDDHEAVSIQLKALPSPEFSSFGVSDYSKT